jgi:hypothetical protein
MDAKNPSKGKEDQVIPEVETPGQIMTFFSCQAGDSTATNSQFANAIQIEFKRQLGRYGYVKTCDNRKLISLIPKLDTRDSTQMSLRWEVQGFIPSPSLEEQIASLKQENLDQAKQMKIKINKQESKIIDQEVRIKELEQQL